MTMRIDKFIEDTLLITRKEAKSLIKNGTVSVNDEKVKDCGFHVNENDIVIYQNQKLIYTKYRYYVLNKPAGYITATEDRNCATVLDILRTNLRKDISPVGRLDKDTEGLLLLTNDGNLAHELLSPRKHVCKTYNCILRDNVNDGTLRRLEAGVDIGEERDTLPAKAVLINDKQVHLTITEGKYHQVKRMFEAVGNEVTYLERISFGPLNLSDMKLERGSYRELTAEEIASLRPETNE